MITGQKLLMKSLEQIRNEKGLTQKEFARKEFSITREQYNRWVQGVNKPRRESLKRIVSYLQDESPALKIEQSLTWTKDEIGIMKIDGRVVLIDMNEKVVLNIGSDTVEAAEELLKDK